jgi:tetratricopeptide (TPR) repeat protein
MFVVTGLILMMALMLTAQDYKGKARQSGTILDEEGNPIDGVTIKLFYVQSQDGFEVKSDKRGRWTAAWIRNGGWNIDFEKIGYEPQKITIQISEVKKNPDIEVVMRKIEGLALTTDIKELLMEGNKLFDEGNYEAAIAKFQEILEGHPDAYPLYQNLGNCYFAQDDYDKAEEYYLKVLEHEADNLDAIIAIGNCYSNRGDTDKALEWYGKVEYENINDPTVLYNLGTNYYNNAKFDEAQKFYEKALEKQKESLDTLKQLGLTYLNLQKNDEAIAIFEEYLKLDSDSPQADQVRAFLDYLRKK